MIHFQTAVVAHLQQFVLDHRNVFWFAIRRQAHHFVFAAVNSESGVVSERAIEQSQTIGKAQLLEERDLVSFTDADRAGGPLANAVDGQDGSFFERRRVECAGCMTLVMIAEEQLPSELFSQLLRGAFILFTTCLCQLSANQVGHPKLLLHPERQRFEKRTESGGRIIEVGFEQTVEFQQRLVIEAYVVQVFGVEFGFAETVERGVEWETMVMLYARESFFLRRSYDLAVNDQTGGGVVIES